MEVGGLVAGRMGVRGGREVELILPQGALMGFAMGAKAETDLYFVEFLRNCYMDMRGEGGGPPGDDEGLSKLPSRTKCLQETDRVREGGKEVGK